MTNSYIKSLYNIIYLIYPIIDVFLKPGKKKLIKKLNNLKRGKLLEIGIGTGTATKHYKHNVVGIDISKKMIAKAKKNNKNADIRIMNAERLYFENNTFDYVVMSHIIATSDKPEKIIRESYRVLKEGGSLFLLNHVVTPGILGSLDKWLSKLSKILGLNSNFVIEDIKNLNNFELMSKEPASFGGYIYLYIYKKKQGN